MGKQKNLFLGIQGVNGSSAGEGTHNMSQISRDYHVTRSLLYAWIRLYYEWYGFFGTFHQRQHGQDCCLTCYNCHVESSEPSYLAQ
jgi:hypothetical protein